jgi:hypothetical protein
MKRWGFVSGFAAFAILPTRVQAAVSTIIAVRSNMPELESEAEDTLAGELRNRGVNTVDPSAIDTTYHERSRVEVTRLLNFASVSFSSISWVTQKYHAQRLLVADFESTSSILPYGQFSVYNIRGRCSYRAFDTVDKRIVAAGSVYGVGRSEDERTAQDQALQSAMQAIAEQAARHLA